MRAENEDNFDLLGLLNPTVVQLLKREKSGQKRKMFLSKDYVEAKVASFHDGGRLEPKLQAVRTHDFHHLPTCPTSVVFALCVLLHSAVCADDSPLRCELGRRGSSSRGGAAIGQSACGPNSD